MKIVIAGGSGQVGGILARHFHRSGHTVIVLSRGRPPAPWRVATWDAATLGPWVAELESSDVLINLAGRSVNCRYTPENRQAILDSRVLSTEVLHRALARLQNPPAVWLNASTATIYRHAPDRPMDEWTGEIGGEEPDAPARWGFSIHVAKAWEAAFFGTSTPKTRQIAMRSAIAFSPDRGGAFDVFMHLVRYGLGGANLPGDQFVSWVHDSDLVRAVDFLIDRQSIEGIVNLASPHPLPNREFLAILRKAYGTRIGLPTTRWMLDIGTRLLRTESELVLKSRRVVPGRLLDAGFVFEYPTWRQAAADLVTRWNADLLE